MAALASVVVDGTMTVVVAIAVVIVTGDVHGYGGWLWVSSCGLVVVPSVAVMGGPGTSRARFLCLPFFCQAPPASKAVHCTLFWLSASSKRLHSGLLQLGSFRCFRSLQGLHQMEVGTVSLAHCLLKGQRVD